MKRALNEVSSDQNSKVRPNLARNGPTQPPDKPQAPILKSEPRPEPEQARAFAFFQNLIQAPTDQKENASQPTPQKKAGKDRRPADAERAKNFRANWRTVDEANDWLLRLTSRSDLKLPKDPKAPTSPFWLPEEVQKLVVRHMSAQAAANWSLVCKYNYGMVASLRPLTRLPTFLQFFPASRTPPPTGLVELVLDWLAPDNQPRLDAALYTPLDQRVHWVMTLALMGALSNSSPKKTLALAEQAVLALGGCALNALSDLLRDYGRQHESVGVELNAEAQRCALSQLIPLLLPLLNQGDQDCAQTWLRLARFLPLVAVDEWTPFPEEASIILGDNAMLHIEVLGLVSPEEKVWPQRDEESKLKLARNCLSDYLGYARNASALLARVSEKRQRVTAAQKIPLLSRLIVTRHIVRLPEILGLKPPFEQALVPQGLALLELEVKTLAHKLLSECVLADQEISDCLEGVCSAKAASKSLISSMLWRFGRLTALALDQSREQPELLATLKAIGDQWPRAQSGAMVSQWLKEKTGA